jgi:hypothetical protein
MRENYTVNDGQSKEDLLKQIYKLQKRNSKKRGHPPPKYSYGDFRDWALQDRDFLTLYNDWEAAEFEPDLRPSCDRIMDNHGYSFENIQWMTFRDNISKPKQLQQLRIAVFDKRKSVIAIFFGLNNAATIMGHSTQTIKDAMQNKKYVGNYKFVELPDNWKS